MRIVWTIFAPFLVTMGIRLILFIIGIIIVYLGKIGTSITLLDNSTNHDMRHFASTIGGFNIFSWNESWLFLALVIIGTFIAELNIWDDNTWD